MKQSFELKWRRAFALGALVLVLPAARAQEGGASTNLSLTPEALVAEALEMNPELRFYEAEIAAARAGRKNAGQWANPEVSGVVGQKRVTGGGLPKRAKAASSI